MLKAVIYLFHSDRIRSKEEIPLRAEANNPDLTDYWMIEGPRAYRQSIISDKIRNLDVSRNLSHRT